MILLGTYFCIIQSLRYSNIWTHKNYDYEVLFLYLNCASLSVTLSLHFSSCFNTRSSGSLARKDNTKYLAVLSFMTLQLAGNNSPQTSLHYWKYSLV